jgi:excisionase family DNA binding protein
MARKRSDRTGPTYFTTFQVAKMLGVSPPTVVNWVNGGLLTAHRTPGGHRRIARDDIARFADEHHYPLAAELSTAPPISSGKKVLIVDDEPDFCAMVKDYLSLRGGFEVEIADSGFSAGLTVARFRPGVILMDILMPDMDGFEVVKMLRQDPEMRAIPVIACTAYKDPQIEERVRREGFNGFMLKPIKLDSLLTAMEQALHGPI